LNIELSLKAPKIPGRYEAIFRPGVPHGSSTFYFGKEIIITLEVVLDQPPVHEEHEDLNIFQRFEESKVIIPP